MSASGGHPTKIKLSTRSLRSRQQQDAEEAETAQDDGHDDPEAGDAFVDDAGEADAQDAYQEEDQTQVQAQAQMAAPAISGSEFGDEEIPEPEQSDYNDEDSPPPKRAGRSSTRRAPPKKRVVERDYNDDGSDYDSGGAYNSEQSFIYLLVLISLQLAPPVLDADALRREAECSISWNSTTQMATTTNSLCVAAVGVFQPPAPADKAGQWCSTFRLRRSSRSATRSLLTREQTERRGGGPLCTPTTKTSTLQNVATTHSGQGANAPTTLYHRLSWTFVRAQTKSLACRHSLLCNILVSTSYR